MKRLLLTILVLLFASPVAATWQRGVNNSTATLCTDSRLRPGDVCWWTAVDADDGTFTTYLDASQCATVTYMVVEEDLSGAGISVLFQWCEPTDDTSDDCVSILPAATTVSTIGVFGGNIPFVRGALTTVDAAGLSIGFACGGSPH